METIVGIEALKDQFRLAKIKVGDLRGLKNSFKLTKRFKIPEIQTAFYHCGGNGDERMEVYADITIEGGSSSFWEYSMKDMVKAIEDSSAKKFTIAIYNAKWNADRTEADRKLVIPEFTFKKKIKPVGWAVRLKKKHHTEYHTMETGGKSVKEIREMYSPKYDIKWIKAIAWS